MEFALEKAIESVEMTIAYRDNQHAALSLRGWDRGDIPILALAFTTVFRQIRMGIASLPKCLDLIVRTLLRKECLRSDVTVLA